MLSVIIVVFHLLCFLSIGYVLAAKIIKKGFAPKEIIYILSVACVSLVYLMLFATYVINVGLGNVLSLGIHLVGMAVFVYIVNGLVAKRNFRLNVYFAIPTLMTLLFFSVFITTSQSCRNNYQADNMDNTSYCHIEALPVDNILPFLFAKNVLLNTENIPIGDWNLVDRTPIQIGTALSVMRFYSVLDNEGPFSAYILIATFYQLAWIGALFGFLALIKTKLESSLYIIAILGLSSFVYINSVFVWPKFYSASLVILGAALLLYPKELKAKYIPVTFMAFSLGLMTHTGVLFTLVGLLPLLAYLIYKHGIKRWSKNDYRYLLLGCSIALLIFIPWQIYKGTRTTSDRLVKWHLAGVIDPNDSRGTFRTIIDSYTKLEVREWVSGRIDNIEMLMQPLKVDRRLSESNFSLVARWVRTNSFFIAFVALGILNVGWFTLLSKKVRSRIGYVERRTLGAVAISLLCWTLVMFLPGSTVIHQGSYASMLLLMVVLGIFMSHFNKRVLWLLLIIQAIVFVLSWIVVGTFINKLSIFSVSIQLAMVFFIPFTIRLLVRPGIVTRSLAQSDL